MKQIIKGTVHSDKADKTIVIRVVMRQTHPIYKKQYTRHRKFMAHDEKNEAKVGDLVTIRESRPISRRKKFVLDKIIERAEVGFEETDTTADIPMEEIEKKEHPEPAPTPKPKSKKASPGKIKNPAGDSS
jgi:small subunit ribosomal protein S17